MTKDGAERLLELIRKKGTIDGYTVKSVLGYGGSAVVFDAVDEAGTAFALKFYEARFVDQTDRLQRELSLKGHDCPTLVEIFVAESPVSAGQRLEVSP